MRRVISLGVFASVVVLSSAPLPLAAQAPPSVTPPGVALFEGNWIDLRAGWGEAQACMVFQTAAIVECFRSAAEMAVREEEVSAVSASRRGDEATLSTQSASWSCSSPLRLYEHGNFGGRQLSFWDAGLWQNLGDWGFNDQLSSYRVGSCYVYLAEHSWGGGWWYPGNTSPWHWEASMISSWNDRISSIYNE